MSDVFVGRRPELVGRVLWLLTLCAPAVANVTLDTPGLLAAVVLTATALGTIAWGVALVRFHRVSERTFAWTAVIGGLVVAGSSAVRAVFERSLPATVGWSFTAVLLCMGVVGVLIAVGLAVGQVRRGVQAPPADVSSAVGGLAVGLVISAVVYLVATFTVGFATQSTSATAIAAAVGVGLAAWLPGRSLLQHRRSTSRALGAGLCLGAAVSVSGLVGLATWAHLGPYGLTTQQISRQLAGSGFPVYLGEYAAGMRLVSVSQEDGGVFFEYGRCMEGVDVGGGGADYSCTSPVEVTNESPSSWEQADEGCIRVAPVRGVPAVISSHRLTLFTGPSAVSILAWKSDSEGYIGNPARARDLARWVRAFGAESAPALAPPEAASLALVNSRCHP